MGIKTEAVFCVLPPFLFPPLFKGRIKVGLFLFEEVVSPKFKWGEREGVPPIIFLSNVGSFLIFLMLKIRLVFSFNFLLSFSKRQPVNIIICFLFLFVKREKGYCIILDQYCTNLFSY